MLCITYLPPYDFSVSDGTVDIIEAVEVIGVTVVVVSFINSLRISPTKIGADALLNVIIRVDKNIDFVFAMACHNGRKT